ncbi:MAG: hypothetical protein M1836_002888 [Candelina mexicana]|nr:MAG: hypothetical protein M1836_002888 [Candelina mexicana]
MPKCLSLLPAGYLEWLDDRATEGTESTVTEEELSDALKFSAKPAEQHKATPEADLNRAKYKAYAIEYRADRDHDRADGDHQLADEDHASLATPQDPKPKISNNGTECVGACGHEKEDRIENGLSAEEGNKQVETAKELALIQRGKSEDKQDMDAANKKENYRIRQDKAKDMQRIAKGKGDDKEDVRFEKAKVMERIKNDDGVEKIIGEEQKGIDERRRGKKNEDEVITAEKKASEEGKAEDKWEKVRGQNEGKYNKHNDKNEQ